MKIIHCLIPTLLCLSLASFVFAEETQATAQPSESETVAQPMAQPAAPPAGRLIIQVSGIKKHKGELRCRIYDNEANFPSKDEEKIFRLIKVPVEGDTATILVDQVPLGQYAVILHHDLNTDGKMNRHWYGPPKEPVGCSNDAKGSFGPPKWKDAVFELNTNELPVPINMN
ncbi:DUF2141 domain-containing protein [bacterium]|nr:DUF2141 domain-containing protein [bacterium]